MVAQKQFYENSKGAIKGEIITYCYRELHKTVRLLRPKYTIGLGERWGD